jgi:erythromycin esterase-like protein
MADGTTLRNTVRTATRPLTGAFDDFDPLLELIGDARFVLLGEATHGTHEFYQTRAAITQRLIAEAGITAVTVEADWPDAYRVNRFVHGRGDAATAAEALEDFKRFPVWMWRNADVLDFVGWLRDHNDARSKDSAHTGFYGLDLYSLNASREAVIRYLERVDPAAAQRVPALLLRRVRTVGPHPAGCFRRDGLAATSRRQRPPQHSTSTAPAQHQHSTSTAKELVSWA